MIEVGAYIMKIANNYIELIGKTPLLRLNNYEKLIGSKAEIIVKLENHNQIGRAHV